VAQLAKAVGSKAEGSIGARVLDVCDRLERVELLLFSCSFEQFREIDEMLKGLRDERRQSSASQQPVYETPQKARPQPLRPISERRKGTAQSRRPSAEVDISIDDVMLDVSGTSEPEASLPSHPHQCRLRASTPGRERSPARAGAGHLRLDESRCEERPDNLRASAETLRSSVHKASSSEVNAEGVACGSDGEGEFLSFEDMIARMSDIPSYDGCTRASTTQWWEPDLL